MLLLHCLTASRQCFINFKAFLYGRSSFNTWIFCWSQPHAVKLQKKLYKIYIYRIASVAGVTIDTWAMNHYSSLCSSVYRIVLHVKNNLNGWLHAEPKETALNKLRLRRVMLWLGYICTTCAICLQYRLFRAECFLLFYFSLCHFLSP